MIACRHPQCRPGSTECAARERVLVAADLELRRSDGWEPPPVKLHTMLRDVSQMMSFELASADELPAGWCGRSGKGVPIVVEDSEADDLLEGTDRIRVITGRCPCRCPDRPGYHCTADDCRNDPPVPAAVADTPTIPVPDMRLVDAELWLTILADARQQLDNIRGTATLMHRGRPELVDQAVATWHRNNPGLSKAIYLADLTPDEGSSRVH